MKRVRLKRPGRKEAVIGAAVGLPVAGAVVAGLAADPAAAEKIEAAERAQRSGGSSYLDSTSTDLANLADPSTFDGLGMAISGAGRLIAAGAEGAAGAARTLGEAAGSGLSQLSGVVDAAGNVGGGILDVAGTVGGGLVDVAGAVGGALPEIAGAVVDVAGAVGEGAGEVLGALGDLDL